MSEVPKLAIASIDQLELGLLPAFALAAENHPYYKVGYLSCILDQASVANASEAQQPPDETTAR